MGAKTVQREKLHCFSKFPAMLGKADLSLQAGVHGHAGLQRQLARLQRRNQPVRLCMPVCYPTHCSAPQCVTKQ